MLDFCSRVLDPLGPSRLLEGRTLVKGATLWYDSSYQRGKRGIPIPVNEDGQCVVAKELHTDNDKGACAQRKKCESCSECKPITGFFSVLANSKS